MVGVTYSEKPSKQSQKRLAVIVKPEKVDSMISSLREMGLEATIYDVKGGLARISKGLLLEEERVSHLNLHILQEKWWLR